MAGRIFISYRRVDSQYATDRIYERLEAHFGSDSVFMDIDDIPLGVNFREYIDEQIGKSDIVLTVIGDIWLTAADANGGIRLMDPNDFVRLEVEAALKQNIKLIPLYIGGVQALPPQQLPDSLQELYMLNAIRIRRSKDFLPDVDRLIKAIENILAEQASQREANRSALAAIEHSLPELASRINSLEDLAPEELRRQRKMTETAEKLAHKVRQTLSEPAKQLRIDLESIEMEVSKLQDDLFTLKLQIEERKRYHDLAQAQKEGEQAEEARRAIQVSENHSRLATISSLLSEVVGEAGQLQNLKISERRAQAAIQRSGEMTLRTIQRMMETPEGLLQTDVGIYEQRLAQLQSDCFDLMAEVEERKEKQDVEDAQRQRAQAEFSDKRQITREQKVKERPEVERRSQNIAASPQLAADQTLVPVQAELIKLPKPPRKWKNLLQMIPAWALGGGGVVIVALVFGLTQLFGGGLPFSRVQPSITPTNTRPALATHTQTDTAAPTGTATITPKPTNTSTPVPTVAPIDSKVNPKDGVVLVYIPAGEFQMGSDDPINNASPVTTVSTGAYWVYQTEVTNEMYAEFLNAVDYGHYEATVGLDWTDGEWMAKEAYLKKPVVNVSWDDAKAYCAWAGARLLSEAEWEKAARGGLDGKLYPWGDELPTPFSSMVNGAFYSTTYNLQLFPEVGSYYPNGFGLYDMAGSVKEWTKTCFAPFPYDARDGREITWMPCEKRVVRGDNSATSTMEVARRMQYFESQIDERTGFRCGMDAP